MIDLTQTPKRLKQSILMEAMQGKLTKQLSSDGDASDLLKRIQQRKQYLINIKKVRNYKLKPIDINDVSFDVPNNWRLVRLGDVAFLNAGKNLNKYSSANRLSNNETLYIKVADMNSINNQIVINDSHLYIKNSKYHLPVPSIIFPKIGGAIKTNKRRQVLKPDIYIDPNIMSVTPFLIKMFPFLWRFMKGIDLSKIQSGSAVPALSQKNVNNIIIPIPPLAEQERIVQRLDQVLPRINDLNQDVIRLHSIRKAFPHRLRQSLLIEAMQGKLTKQLPSDGNADELLQKIQQKKQALIKTGKIRRHKKLPPISEDEIPFKIPKNWKWVRLGHISNYIQRGKSPKYGKDGIPVISQKCVRWNRIDLSKAKFIKKSSLTKYKSIRFLKPNDLLWNSTGTGTIGRATLVNDSLIKKFPKLVVDGHVTIIRINIVNPKFLYLFIRSDIVQDKINDMASGSTKQIELGKKVIENLLIPLPPLSEQKRIVGNLNNIINWR